MKSLEKKNSWRSLNIFLITFFLKCMSMKQWMVVTNKNWFVIVVVNCPIMCQSKLQLSMKQWIILSVLKQNSICDYGCNFHIMCLTNLRSEIPLAMMKVKIVALAQRCCKLFPTMDAVSLMGKAISLPLDIVTIQVLIHENNNGALFTTKTLLSIHFSKQKLPNKINLVLREDCEAYDWVA